MWVLGMNPGPSAREAGALPYSPQDLKILNPTVLVLKSLGIQRAFWFQTS